MVKKVLFSFFLILILLTTSVLAITGKATGSTVRIREKPALNSIEVSVAKKGEIVNVIGEENGWYKVTFENVTGYMSKEYVDTDYKAGDQDEEPDLTPSTTPDTTPDNQEQTPEPETPTTEIDNPPETDEVSDNVTPETPAETETPSEVPEKDLTENQKVTFDNDTDLRYLPNFTSRTRGVASSGSEYTIVESLNKWVKVSNDTNTGWVLKTKVTEKVEE